MCHCGHLNLSHQVHSSSQEAQWNHCNITYTKSIAAQLNLLLSFKQPDWWAGNFMSVPFLLSANFQIPFFRFHWCYFLSLTDKRWSNKKKKKNPPQNNSNLMLSQYPRKNPCALHIWGFLLYFMWKAYISYGSSQVLNSTKIHSHYKKGFNLIS